MLISRADLGTSNCASLKFNMPPGAIFRRFGFNVQLYTGRLLASFKVIFISGIRCVRLVGLVMLPLAMKKGVPSPRYCNVKLGVVSIVKSGSFKPAPKLPSGTPKTHNAPADAAIMVAKTIAAMVQSFAGLRRGLNGGSWANWLGCRGGSAEIGGGGVSAKVGGGGGDAGGETGLSKAAKPGAAAFMPALTDAGTCSGAGGISGADAAVDAGSSAAGLCGCISGDPPSGGPAAPIARGSFTATFGLAIAGAGGTGGGNVPG